MEWGGGKMATKHSAEAIHQMLGRLLAEMPDFRHDRRETLEDQKWLARTRALLTEAGFNLEAVEFDNGSHLLNSQYQIYDGVRSMRLALETALAKAELRAPVASAGSFIPAGATYSAFGAVGVVLGRAKSDLLLIDPYADEKMFDFVTLVPAGVTARLLADTATVKPSLAPAAKKWAEQYGSARPLEARVAVSRSLHDRLIIVDEKEAYVLGQSFKDLAQRAHSSIVRADPEVAAMKVAAYRAIWAASTTI
jgi:hypothetical protein